MKKIICNLYFDLGVGTDYFYHGQNHFVGVHTGDLLRINTRDRDAVIPRLPAEIFPEYILIRVNEFDKVASTPLDEWIEYLKDGTIRPDTTAPGLREAREKLKYDSMSRGERYAYDEHLTNVVIQKDAIENAKWEGLVEGRAEGLEKGLVEGLEKGLAEGEAKGLEKGRAEGGKQTQFAIARNLKALSLPPETIIQATGLSVEEIESL